MKVVRVAGVTFEGRQDLIKKLSLKSCVNLKPEPSNPYDPYAIKVIADDMHIGYIPKDLARKISETWDLYSYKIKISEIFEGDDSEKHRRSWGVRILVGRRKKNAHI